MGYEGHRTEEGRQGRNLYVENGVTTGKERKYTPQLLHVQRQRIQGKIVAGDCVIRRG